MKTTDTRAAARRRDAPAPRPDDKMRRYLLARERLESRRRARGDRFGYLRRGHD